MDYLHFKQQGGQHLPECHTAFSNHMENHSGFLPVEGSACSGLSNTGVTSNLPLRMERHRSGYYKNAFSHKYNVTELVYFEEFESIDDAIVREKQIKAGSRQKKIDLINSLNSEWKDLSTAFLK